MAITNFIPTVWSENLYTALDKKYVGVANCNRAFEGDIREAGSVVKILGVGDVTVSDYTKNTDLSSPEALSDTVRELTINQAKCFNFQIDDVDRAQAKPQLMNEAMKVAANALAATADTYVYSLYGSAGTTVSQASVSAANVLDSLISARTKLLKEGVTDPSDIVIEVSPEVAELILKAKITSATDNSDVLENGCIGSVGGCKIYVSGNIATVADTANKKVYHKCFARTRRAIAFAEQLSEIEAYRPEKRFADAVKGLHLYGAKVVYPKELILLDLCFAA